MIRELFQTYKTLPVEFDKDVVIDGLTKVLDLLNNNTIPTIDDLIKEAKDSTEIQNSKILIELNKVAKLGAKDNRDVLVKLKGIMTNISKAGTNLTDTADDLLPEIITDKTATVRDVTIIKIINDITTMVLYMQDYFYIIINDGKESNYPAKKLKDISLRALDFHYMILKYKEDFNKMINDIPKVSGALMSGADERNFSILEKLAGSTGKLLSIANTNGFAGSPIYLYRMWRADKEIAKYESAKQKRELMRVKLMALKAQREGQGGDAKLQKQIDYYENKIDGIDYEVMKIEEKNH